MAKAASVVWISAALLISAIPSRLAPYLCRLSSISRDHNRRSVHPKNRIRVKIHPFPAFHLITLDRLFIYISVSYEKYLSGAFGGCSLIPVQLRGVIIATQGVPASDPCTAQHGSAGNQRRQKRSKPQGSGKAADFTAFIYRNLEDCPWTLSIAT